MNGEKLTRIFEENDGLPQVLWGSLSPLQEKPVIYYRQIIVLSIFSPQIANVPRTEMGTIPIAALLGYQRSILWLT